MMDGEESLKDTESRALLLRSELENLLLRNGLSHEEISIAFKVLSGHFEEESRITANGDVCKKVAFQKLSHFIARAILGPTADQGSIENYASHYYALTISLVANASFYVILKLVDLVSSNLPSFAIVEPDWLERCYVDFAEARRGNVQRRDLEGSGTKTP